jgi:hypothetical protein
MDGENSTLIFGRTFVNVSMYLQCDNNVIIDFKKMSTKREWINKLWDTCTRVYYM